MSGEEPRFDSSSPMMIGCFKIFVIMLTLVTFSSFSYSQEGPLPPVGGEEMLPNASFLEVAMLIDRDKVETKLVLEVVRNPIHLTFSRFSQEARDLEEESFASLITALKDGDANVAGEFHRSLQPQNGGGQEMARMFINGFRDAWPTMQVIASYDLGPERVFAWEINLAGKQIRRTTRISRRLEDLNSRSFWLEEIATTGLPGLQNVLADAEQLLLEQSSDLLPQAEALQLTYREQAPELDAYWRFNGIPARWDALSAKSRDIPDHPAAKFYRQAMDRFASGNAEAYANLHTKYSAEKIRRWNTGLEAGAFQAYVDEEKSFGREIVFILDAAPVFLMFYERNDGLIKYDVVYQDPEQGFRLANFFVEGIFDNLVQDEPFFFNSVLRPHFAHLLKGKQVIDESEPRPAPFPGAIPRKGEKPYNAPPLKKEKSPEDSPSEEEALDQSHAQSKKPSSDTNSSLPKPSLWTPIIIVALLIAALCGLFYFIKQRS